MVDNLRGFWKDDSDAKAKKKKKRRKKRNKLKYDSNNTSFYSSKEWRNIRYQVIKKNSGECMACGRSKKVHGIVIHVDHIKPRSKHPRLALCFENLQLLCKDCNSGKSNTDETDWRPVTTDYEIALDKAMINNPDYIYQ